MTTVAQPIRATRADRTALKPCVTRWNVCSTSDPGFKRRDKLSAWLWTIAPGLAVPRSYARGVLSCATFAILHRGSRLRLGHHGLWRRQHPESIRPILGRRRSSPQVQRGQGPVKRRTTGDAGSLLTGTGPVGPATGLGGQSRVLGRKRPVVRLLRRCRKGGTRSDSSRVAEFTQSRSFQAWLSGGTCLGREHRHAPPRRPLPPRPR